MLKIFLKSFLFVVTISALLFTTACSNLLPFKKDLKTDEYGENREQKSQNISDSDKIEEEKIYGKTLKEARINFMNENIHFEFDSYSIVPEYVSILMKKVKWLRNHPSLSVTIEGHCDERGTTAYNISLGERRANAAKQFLIDTGIKASRIETVSYGEEKPLDPGKNDKAWVKNRRAHFVLQ